MGNKLYVGNLPYSIKDQDLNTMFAEVGEVVSAKIITKPWLNPLHIA